jgi:hypothetical protein
LLLADVYQNERFENDKLEALIAEMPEEGDRRHWRVTLAFDRAFAEFLRGGNCVSVLVETAAKEGPFALPTFRMRLKFVLSRLSYLWLFIGAGTVGALVGMIVFNA